jgi:EmrB/QacA subfamily drug resistance transporter
MLRRGSASPALRGHPGLTLLSVSFGLMMVALDSTIVAVANPAVGAHFHASLPGLQWVTDAYLLALAVGLVTGGKLGDHYGRKRVFLAGTAGFALSSLACGLSPTLGALIGFRAAQGAFGALMLPQTLAILRATFPLERLASAVGTWALTSSIGTASGPILGGVLVGELNWRWIFFVNLPIGAVSLALGSVVIRESRDERDNRQLDPGGIGLLSATLFCLVWGLMQAEQHGWVRAETPGWLAGAAIAASGFIFWERHAGRVRTPHIPLRLFKSPQLDTGLGMIVSAVFGIYGVLFFITLFMQRVQGYPAIQAGVRLLALTGVMGISAVIAGQAVAKIGPRIPLFIGSLVISGGLAGLSRLGPTSGYNHLWPFLVLVGLGVGPLQTGASRAVVGGAPPENAGVAGGMYATATQLGGLLGLSVLGTVMVDRVSSVLPAKLASAGVPAVPARQLQGHAAAIAQGVVPVAGNVPAATARAVTTGADAAFASGLDLAMLLTAAVVLAAGLIALGLMRPKPRATPANSLSHEEADRRASARRDQKEQYMSDTGSPYADTSHMYKVHAMFRREFALLPALVRSVPDKDEERADVVAGHIRLVSLVLHHHHSGEDAVVWPALLARAPREIDPVVHLVEGHHQAIEDLLSKIDVLLGTWTSGAASEDSEALAVVLERLAVALYEHMGLEEKLVLPLAERHIFASEWDKMVADEAASIPPEVGPVLAGMLMYEGGLDVVPPEMRAVLAELAPQAYAAHCQRVHGTSAPPRSSEVGIGTPYVGVTA